MTTRRDFLRISACAGAASLLPTELLRAGHHEGLITRAIPKTGEKLPIVGLGTSATFRQLASGDDVSQLEAVISTLLDGGATVFDTAPSYGE
ncbi:MAG TPA: twin-arginine translocation signal domain-containing protein, partial [Woeseiaceae bacterium]|nr:twin-arginine translocation signal domain-containing protein [Woeseiaceae bacterium]